VVGDLSAFHPALILKELAFVGAPVERRDRLGEIYRPLFWAPGKRRWPLEARGRESPPDTAPNRLQKWQRNSSRSPPIDDGVLRLVGMLV
jgi:hypothetical protein